MDDMLDVTHSPLIGKRVRVKDYFYRAFSISRTDGVGRISLDLHSDGSGVDGSCICMVINDAALINFVSFRTAIIEVLDEARRKIRARRQPY